MKSEPNLRRIALKRTLRDESLIITSARADVIKKNEKEVKKMKKRNS